MPELPEVETLVRDLNSSALVGSTILTAQVTWPRSIATPSLPQFLLGIQGKKVAKVSRRAKFIVIHFTDSERLLIHLRMTGHLIFSDTETPRGPHEHIILTLDSKRTLRFQDTRKFGRWYLIEKNNPKLDKLGPEPLDSKFSAQDFQKKINNCNRKLKPLLLDQAFIAGLGNIYVDESLWQAKLHPETSAGSLKPREIVRLHSAIIQVLRQAIQNLGTTLGKTEVNFYSVGGRRGRNQDELKVFRRTGEPCPRCHSPIRRILVAQRSSHICTRCQKKRC